MMWMVGAGSIGEHKTKMAEMASRLDEEKKALAALKEAYDAKSKEEARRLAEVHENDGKRSEELERNRKQHEEAKVTNYTTSSGIKKRYHIINMIWLI
jgi:chromosome segregation ATPase